MGRKSDNATTRFEEGMPPKKVLNESTFLWKVYTIFVALTISGVQIYTFLILNWNFFASVGLSLFLLAIILSFTHVDWARIRYVLRRKQRK